MFMRHKLAPRMLNSTRLKTSNSYYKSTDKLTVQAQLATIRKYCKERGIQFPPSKSEMELLWEETEVFRSEQRARSEPGIMQTILNRILEFLSPIFNARKTVPGTWTREKMWIRSSSVRVQPGVGLETGEMTRPFYRSDHAAGGENITIGTCTTNSKTGCTHIDEPSFVGKSSRPACYKLPVSLEELDEIKICETHNYAPLYAQ